jgi:hypothetical protein
MKNIPYKLQYFIGLSKIIKTPSDVAGASRAAPSVHPHFQPRSPLKVRFAPKKTFPPPPEPHLFRHGTPVCFGTKYPIAN